MYIICWSPLKGQTSDTPFEFPIKPNSEKWQSLKTIEEMYDVCQVPKEVLAGMTTHALIETCLKYPASAILLIHNTPQDGFNEWNKHFNGV